jgi:hypothetical protein
MDSPLPSLLGNRGKMILRYACGSVATGWISLSGQIKGDDPEETGYSGRPY